MKKYVITRGFIRDAQLLNVPLETTDDDLGDALEKADSGGPDSEYGWGNTDDIGMFMGIITAKDSKQALNIASEKYGLSKALLYAQVVK